MRLRLPAPLFLIAVVPALLGSVVGCDRPADGISTIPVTTPTPKPGVLSVTNVVPATGPTDRATPVQIVGDVFEPGTTLTIDGVDTPATFVSSTLMTATAGPHAPGRVVVVVRNPNGRSSQLSNAYLYYLAPSPTVTSITPALGTTLGGTSVTVNGSVLGGATVKLNDIPLVVGFAINSALGFQSPPHAAGPVDLTVTTPDGRSVRVAGGYTYVPPDAIDFNGVWDAYQDQTEEVIFRFTIKNNVLVSLACGTAPPMPLSPAPNVSQGAFSFAGADGASLTGHILSPRDSTGTVAMPSCGSSGWYGIKVSGPGVQSFRR